MVFRHMTENFKPCDYHCTRATSLFLSDLRIPRNPRFNKPTILITVPEILEQLIFGVDGAAICEKVGCLIFDEVHDLCETERRGPIFERLLAAFDVPTFAFSATLFGADIFFNSFFKKFRQHAVMIPEPPKSIPRLTEQIFSVVDPRTPALISKVHPFSLYLASRFSEKDVLTLMKEIVPPDCTSSDLLFSLRKLDDFEELRTFIANRLCINAETSSRDWLLDTLMTSKECQLPITRSAILRFDRSLRQALMEAAVHFRTQTTDFLKLHYDHTFETYFPSDLESLKHRNAPIGLGQSFAQLLNNIERRGHGPTLIYFMSWHVLQETLEDLLDAWREQQVEPPVLPEEFQHVLSRFEGFFSQGQTFAWVQMVKTAWRYGIGIHGSGVPAAYRQWVEIGLEKGQLRAVLSTSTLAAGIHSPCRSVVMAQNHRLLMTPTLFQQIAGRAGRRNYDYAGQVYIFGFKPHAVRLLLSVRFAELRSLVAMPTNLTLSLASVSRTNIETFGVASDPMSPIWSRFRNILSLLALRHEDQEQQAAVDQFQVKLSLSLSLLCRLRLVALEPETTLLRPTLLFPFIMKMPFMEPFSLLIHYILVHPTPSTNVQELRSSSSYAWLFFLIAASVSDSIATTRRRGTPHRLKDAYFLGASGALRAAVVEYNTEISEEARALFPELSAVPRASDGRLQFERGPKSLRYLRSFLPTLDLRICDAVYESLLPLLLLEPNISPDDPAQLWSPGERHAPDGDFLLRHVDEMSKRFNALYAAIQWYVHHTCSCKDAIPTLKLFDTLRIRCSPDQTACVFDEEETVERAGGRVCFFLGAQRQKLQDEIQSVLIRLKQVHWKIRTWKAHFKSPQIRFFRHFGHPILSSDQNFEESEVEAPRTTDEDVLMQATAGHRKNRSSAQIVASALYSLFPLAEPGEFSRSIFPFLHKDKLHHAWVLTTERREAPPVIWIFDYDCDPALSQTPLLETEEAFLSSPYQGSYLPLIQNIRNDYHLVILSLPADLERFHSRFFLLAKSALPKNTQRHFFVMKNPPDHSLDQSFYQFVFDRTTLQQGTQWLSDMIIEKCCEKWKS